MAENKTRPTGNDPWAFIEGVENERRRQDARTLMSLFERATGYPAQMWGEAIIGFGRYHYRYASGREGDHLITGFSPRKSAMAVYVMPGFDKYQAELSRLGKHRHSVSCLYINRLDDIDMEVLEAIVADSAERMRRKYPHWPK